MAKNLKLNIKNTQLAEALKLGKRPTPSKAASPAVKKKKAEAEEAVQEVAAAPLPEEEKLTAAPAAVTEKEPVREEPPVVAPKAAPAPERKPPVEKRPEETRAAAAPQAPRRMETPPPYTQSRPYPPRRPEQNVFSRSPEDQKRPSTFPRATITPGKDWRPDQRRTSPPAPPREPPRTEEPRRARPTPAAAPSGAVEEKPVRKAGEFKEFRDVKSQKKPGENRSFDARDRQGLRSGDDEEWRKRRPSNKGGRGFAQEEVVIRPKELSVRLPISVKDLASAMKLKASQLVSKLFMQGMTLTLNDMLDDETVIQLLGHDFDCEITIDRKEEDRLRITDKTIKQEVLESDPSTLVLRPPVVAFMGHVDHGKTSLIDAIRKSNLAAGEAGAITQHIGAFKCHTAVGDLAILDTPGHEAFSAMRARGADVTDIIVLVIAGDEGIRTQTLEAINQAREAKVPLVVALNKCDKPNFNAENIYRQLADQDLLPEAWGGTILTIPCSATTGQGIKELLEMLALQAEILELKANPQARARGTVIEAEMHKGLGAVATILVQNGTLRLGDSLVFAQHWARVKTMHDEHDKTLTEAPPSTPVKITGLSGLPVAGSEFIAVKNEKEARELSHGRTEGTKQAAFIQTKKVGLEGFLQKKADQPAKKVLPLILRADVQGSLEALRNSLLKIESNKVEINIISAEVGEISESDVSLAAASKATIIGFHTQIESRAEELIKELKVKVKTHDIIYHAVDDTKEIMLGLLDKIPQEMDTGSALVKAVFKSSHLGAIAGCQVIDGNIKRNHHIRVIRDKEVVWKGPIASLKRVKEDVREVSKGYECGILLQNFNDVKEGDILQAYEITYLTQQL